MQKNCRDISQWCKPKFRLTIMLIFCTRIFQDWIIYLRPDHILIFQYQGRMEMRKTAYFLCFRIISEGDDEKVKKPFYFIRITFNRFFLCF